MNNIFKEYNDNKTELTIKHTQVINQIKEWFKENYETPTNKTIIKSVYINERPLIDQLCIDTFEKLSDETINKFTKEFNLKLKIFIIKLQRHYFEDGNQRDKIFYRYSFKENI
jgi:hypothetical protein